MSNFNKTEYHNNNPDQGISVMQDVRDGKSHSNIYLKQVDKRNQIHTQDPRLSTTQTTHRVVANSPIRESPSRELQETMDGEADAYAELEIEYDVEGDDVAYEAEMTRRDFVKRLREVEKEFQDAKQEKQQMRMIEKTGKTDVEARQKLQYSPDTKHFDAFVLAMEKARKCREEDDDDNDDQEDDELDNFIMAIENLTPRFESDVNLCSQHYGDQELMAGGIASEEDMEEYYREQRERMEDAGERLQDEVENRGEDAMDDY